MTLLELIIVSTFKIMLYFPKCFFSNVFLDIWIVSNFKHLKNSFIIPSLLCVIENNDNNSVTLFYPIIFFEIDKTTGIQFENGIQGK